MDNSIMADNTYNETVKPDLMEDALNSSGPVNDHIDALRNKVFDFATKEWGITRKQLEKVMEKVAYHETGRTMDPKQRQIGGPAGGLYQFEQEPSEEYPKASGSATTAENRMINFLTRKGRGLNLPLDYAKLITKNMPDDFSKIDKRLQDIAFLTNYLEHPSDESGLSKAATDDKALKDWYLDVQWAGAPEDRSDRLETFSGNLESYYRKHGR